MPKRFITVDSLRVGGRLRDARLVVVPVADATPPLGWIVHAPAGWQPIGAQLELTRDGVPNRVSLDVGAGVDVPWPFPPLVGGEIADLRVRVRGADARTSDWSEPERLVSTFRADAAGAPSWDAPFIAGIADDARPVRLRIEFDVPPGMRRATLRLAALGAVRAELDGQRVGDDVLAPGWTSYRHRLLVDSHDLPAAVVAGRHTLGLELAGAWFTESYGFGENHARVYGDSPAVAAELELIDDHGAVTNVLTSPLWRVSDDGPVRASGLYAGEEYDARRAQPGWSSPGFDDGTWSRARLVDTRWPTPTARTLPPVRRLAERSVERVLTTPSGATVLDFGQNLVGRVRLTAHGPAGSRIVLRHAEVLEHGELATRPLRRAAATDALVLAGADTETWEPEFTVHGFRYVAVEADPGVVDPGDVVAVVLGTDLERTGEFSCSDPRLEQLHENIVWSARGNFLSIPTDCPQRDERMGWTGDVQVFAPTASFLFDVESFLDSWLEDVGHEQEEHDGVVPVVVPWVLDWDVVEVAAWGDAATVVPHVLHERFGGRSLLARRYPGMRAWCERLLGRAGDGMLIEGGFQFGDWLDPAAPPDDPFAARTPHDLVANAYLVRSLDLTTAAARDLDETADARRFADAAVRAREAFARRFVEADGRLAGDSPTGYALALGFDLLSADRSAALGARLAELVRADGHRIGTGFVGTPLLLDALSSTGHLDDAIDLLLQTESPSWLAPLALGATTMWERWDSMRPDGTLNPGEMTSFNHYALGAVADWLHRRLAGLAPLEPGYRKLHIAPLPTPRLAHASARLRTPYGSAESGWRRTPEGVVHVHATVPTGATARVDLPDGRRLEVGPGSHEWTLR